MFKTTRERQVKSSQRNEEESDFVTLYIPTHARVEITLKKGDSETVRSTEPSRLLRRNNKHCSRWRRHAKCVSAAGLRWRYCLGDLCPCDFAVKRAVECLPCKRHVEDRLGGWGRQARQNGRFARDTSGKLHLNLMAVAKSCEHENARRVRRLRLSWW
jgi:hypothetical protein